MIWYYTTYLRDYKGVSSSYIHNSKKALTELFEFLCARKRTNDIKLMHITLEDIINYIGWFSQQKPNYRSRYKSDKMSRSTIYNRQVMIRLFFKRCNRLNICCLNYLTIETIITPKPEAVFLTEEEREKLFQRPTQETDEPTALRNELLLDFWYYSWCRIHETLSLTFSSIPTERNSIYIKGKWGKHRCIFITQAMREKIKKLKSIQQQRKTPNGNDIQRKHHNDYIFVSYSHNSYGMQLSACAVQNILKRYRRESGIEKQVTPHTLRHTFATDTIKKGVDMYTLQRMLWHADISTTALYTHVHDSALEKAHRIFLGESQ